MSQNARIRIRVARASGPRVGWAKHVQSIDPSQPYSKAFVGPFLRADTLVDLPIGSLVLVVNPEGSYKHGWEQAYVRIVRRNAEEMDDATELVATGNWRQDYLNIRDACVENLRMPVAQQLANFEGISDADLIAEMKRRGLTITVANPESEREQSHV